MDMTFFHRLKCDIDTDQVLGQFSHDDIVNGTILDPSIGGGQFLRAVEKIKRAAGKTDEEIRQTVFGVTKYQMTRNYVVNRYGVISTIMVGDPLKMKWKDMKFDIVLSNPPYNDASTLRRDWDEHKRKGRGSGFGQNLAKQFALLSIKASRKHTALIMPYGGRTYGTGIAETYQKAGLYKIVPTKFPGVNDRIPIGIFYFNHNKIVDKVDDGFLSGLNIPKENITKWFNPHAGKAYRHSYEHLLKDEGKYKIIMTAGTPIKFTNDMKLAKSMEDRTYGHWRVVINHINGTGIGPIVVADPETYLSHSVSAFIVKNKIQAQKLKKYLEQPTVAEIIAKVKHSATNSKKVFQYIEAPF